jgi:hypothetical protein
MEIDRKEKQAYLTWKEFNDLPEYSHTTPTRHTDGKIWRAKLGGEWYLREYQRLPMNDSQRSFMIGINTYPISIVS